MERILHNLSRNGIKWLMLLKVIVIIYVINDQFGLITLGDKALFASEEKREEKNAENATAKEGPARESVKGKEGEKGKEAKGEKKAADDNAGTTITATKPTFEQVKERLAKELYPDENEEKTDTILQKLLTLPTLHKDRVKKEEIGRYLAMIDRKQKLLDDRAVSVKDQEKVLHEMESSIDAKIKKLQEEMSFFKDTQQKEKELEKERVDKLTDFYAKMAPKKSAPVFEKLDKDLVVAMWKKFPEKTTTQILSLMSPAKSVELTEYFGRIKSTREYDVLKEINVDLQKQFSECKGETAKADAPQAR